MAKMTIADLVATTLANAGVERIWGVTGDSLNGLTDSLRRLGKIDWMHVRHEEVAAFAAGAEAAVTGELAVCAGSCGPGNLHLINGLFDCHRTPCRCWRSRRRSRRPRSVSATSRRRIRRSCSASAATIARWSSTPEQMPARAADRDARGGRRSAASPWS